MKTRLIAHLMLVLQLSQLGLPRISFAQTAPDPDGPDPDASSSTASPAASNDPLGLASLLRRATAPNAPGSDGGIPSAQEVAAAETGLLALKKAYEAAPLQASDIEQYTAQLTSLVGLKVVLQMDHSPIWLAKFDLAVPSDAFSKMSQVLSIAQNPLGEHFFSLKQEADAHAGVVRLGLSHSLIQGIEAGAVAANPTEKSLLALVQYFALREQYRRLSDIHYLLNDGSKQEPDSLLLSPDLTAKLPSFFDERDIREEHESAYSELGFRNGLISHSDDLIKGISSKVDGSGLSFIGQLIGGGLTQSAALDQFKTLTRQFGTDGFAVALEGEIRSYPALLTQLQGDALTNALRQIVANARVNILLTVTAKMMSLDNASVSRDQRVSILQQIDGIGAKYSAALPVAPLTSWAARAQAAVTEELYTKVQKSYVDDITKASLLVQEANNPTGSTDTEKAKVQPSVLLKLFEDKLDGLHASTGVGAWIQQIMSDPQAMPGAASAPADWLSARNRYSELVAKLVGPSLIHRIPDLQAGLVDSAAARAFIGAHDWSPAASFKLPILPQLKLMLNGNVATERKNDLLALIQIGDWLGFHKSFASGSPSALEFFPDLKDRKRYLLALADDQALTQFPILGFQVSWLGPSRARAHQHPQYALSYAIQSAQQQQLPQLILPMVQQALAQYQANGLDLLKRIAAASSLSQIEVIAGSSDVVGPLMNQYPQFHAQQDAWAKKAASRSLPDLLMDRYFGPYVNYSFGGIMVVQGLSWAAQGLGWTALRFAKFPTPLLGAFVSVEQTLMRSTFIRGALAASTVLMFPQTYYQTKQFLGLRQRYVDTKQLRDAGGSVTFSAMDALTKGYFMSRLSFIGGTAMNLFFFVPMSFQAFRMIGRIKPFAAAVQSDFAAFGKLGLRPYDYHGLSGAILTARNNENLKPAELAEMEQVYRMLSDRVRGEPQVIDVESQLVEPKLLGNGP